MGEQPITREFVMQQVAQLPPDNLAEVARFIEFLQFKAQSAFKTPLPHRGEHPAFGLWADRSDIQDSIKFTQTRKHSIPKEAVRTALFAALVHDLCRSKMQSNIMQRRISQLSKIMRFCC
jgi:hypothetical protein